MINEIKEIYQIAKEALTAWRKGGFGTKAGNEAWLKEFYRRERMNDLVMELKKLERERGKPDEVA